MDHDETVRFAIRDGLASSCPSEPLNASNAEPVVEAIVKSLFSAHLRWAIEAKLAALGSM
jgi:hypothetical protein